MDRVLLDICIDIETAPIEDERYLSEQMAIKIKWQQARADIRAPSNYKDPEKIKQWLDEHGAEKRAAIDEAEAVEVKEHDKKCSLDPARGRVVCIGLAWGYLGGDVETKCILADDPTKEHGAIVEALEELVAAREARATIVGHCVDFDLGFLRRRLIATSRDADRRSPAFAIPWLQWLAPAWRHNADVRDTSYLWTLSTQRISLSDLCRVLGVESPKATHDGGSVLSLVRAQRWGDLDEYCLGDVRATLACSAALRGFV